MKILLNYKKFIIGDGDHQCVKVHLGESELRKIANSTHLLAQITNMIYLQQFQMCKPQWTNYNVSLWEPRHKNTILHLKKTPSKTC